MKSVHRPFEFPQALAHRLKIKRAFQSVRFGEEQHPPVSLHALAALGQRSHRGRAGPGGRVITAGVPLADFSHLFVITQASGLDRSELGKAAFCGKRFDGGENVHFSASLAPVRELFDAKAFPTERDPVGVRSDPLPAKALTAPVDPMQVEIVVYFQYHG